LGGPGGSAATGPARAAAGGGVPKKTVLGEGSSLAIKSVRREDAVGRRRVIVDVAAPAAARVALFAEGPTPDWALPVPKAIDGAPAGLQRFAFALDGAPPGATYDGAAIALTAVAGNIAIEVVTRLDQFVGRANLGARGPPQAGSPSGTARLKTGFNGKREEENHAHQGRRSTARGEVSRDDVGRAGVEDHRRNLQGQEGRAVCGA